MAKRKPHRFGHFRKAKHIRVRGWSLPQNRDDDVIYFELGDRAPEGREWPEMRRRKGRR